MTVALLMRWCLPATQGSKEERKEVSGKEGRVELVPKDERIWIEKLRMQQSSEGKL